MRRLFAVLSLTTLACTGVDATEHCVQTRYGKIVNEKLDEGLNWTPLTDETCFSLTDIVYPSGQDGDGNKETIDAQSSDPVTIVSDLSVTYAYDRTKVVEVFKDKRSPAAVEVEVVNAIRSGYRSALASWSINDIFSPRRASLDDSVRAHIQRKIGNRVVIKQVFVRDVKVPKSIEDARTISGRKEAELDAAKQQEAIAKAEANATIAKARGDAESNELRAKSYSTNPKLLDLEIAKAMSGLCGTATTCVIGGSTTDLLGLRKQ